MLYIIDIILYYAILRWFETVITKFVHLFFLKNYCRSNLVPTFACRRVSCLETFFTINNGHNLYILLQSVEACGLISYVKNNGNRLVGTLWNFDSNFRKLSQWQHLTDPAICIILLIAVTCITVQVSPLSCESFILVCT